MTLTYSILTYLGTIPFLFVSALFGAQFYEILHIDLENLKTIISIYTIAIISFISGSHWGLNLNNNNFLSRFTLISSNIFVLFSWLAYLFLLFEIFIFAASVVFILLLFIDQKLSYLDYYSEKYFQNRLIATIIVLLSFFIMIYFSSIN